MASRKIAIGGLILVFLVLNGVSYLTSRLNLWPDEYLLASSICLFLSLAAGVAIILVVHRRMIAILLVFITIVVFQRWFLEVLILSVFWSIQGFAP